MTQSFVPVLIMLLIAIGLGVVLIALSYFARRHQRTPVKLAPYESGVPIFEGARKRINVRFYQITMLFILFDIEAAFLYPWAVIYRDATVTAAGVQWFLFGEMFLFILLLAIGYVYVWKKRTLDWK